MKKIFITGGSGSVGSSFVERYSDEFQILSYSRNEKMQVALKRRFPKIEISMGSVEDDVDLKIAIRQFSPDVILHCAALKHVETSELNPRVAINANIIGSLNVVEAACENDVPITLGVSTDKACEPDNAYGYTKALMENLFLKASTSRNRFSVTRFGNVAFSHGSVLPYWLGLAQEGKPLPLTDKRMNRLMFSQSEAAELIYKGLLKMETDPRPVIISKLMKNVNMFEMAQLISKDIELVGFRPGEVLNETLISSSELSRTELDGELVYIHQHETDEEVRLTNEYSSVSAENMTVDEMKSLLETTSDRLNGSMLQEKHY